MKSNEKREEEFGNNGEFGSVAATSRVMEVNGGMQGSAADINTSGGC